jgi:photosystem II stability/assembly factor-like uncharacterized protein
LVKHTGNLFAVFFLIFVLNLQVFATDIWLAQQSNTSQKLFKCFFIDSLKGWCVGDSGTILITSNGGNNWNRQPTGLNHFIFDLCFINSLSGWCIASDINAFPNPVLLKTTNGGVNWQHFLMPDTNMLLFTCYFKNSLTGWLAGYNGVILKSSDGGNNWINVRDTSEFGWHSVWDISSDNTSFVYSCGGTLDFAGVVAKSNQGGTDWYSQGIAPEPIFKVIYSDSANGFGAGGDFEYGASIVRTTDGGNLWHYENLGFFGVPRSFAYRTSNEIWMPLSFGGSWGVSTDGGFNWVQIPAVNNTSLNDVCFTDDHHGWAVGDNGVILKYNSDAIGILNYSGIAGDFRLYQNYPNPFNNSTIIEFSVNKVSRVKLTLYDASGKLVKIILDEFMQPGNKKIPLYADNFSSGIYFYKITTVSGTTSRKLVIVK